MSAAAIRVENASKRFRLPHRTTVREHFLHPLRRTAHEVQHALRDVTFEVGWGEFFGIVGPNGSGKSTLLKLIAGIYRQDSGRVHVGGQLSPFIELSIGFNPELSARDNIRIAGTLLGLSRRELDRGFDEIIEFAELERFVDQKLKNFSSGMEARLAYSIAIRAPFDILLLDEVLAVGDESFREKCYATFERMQEEGRTVVLVSHDLTSVTRFCDRAMLLEQGVVTALGQPAEVVDAYVRHVAA